MSLCARTRARAGAPVARPCTRAFSAHSHDGHGHGADDAHAHLSPLAQKYHATQEHFAGIEVGALCR